MIFWIELTLTHYIFLYAGGVNTDIIISSYDYHFLVSCV